MATAPDYSQQELHHDTEESADCQYVYDDHSWEEQKAAELKELVPKAWPQGVELYSRQMADLWPTIGKHILANYDDQNIVVYQAFCPAIAEAAVKDQRFGGGGFSFTRMSWIKTNFLWMMYRCGWAAKRDQERVLAIKITQDGFNQILAEALTAELQKSQGLGECKVRLQWDPDHSPSGQKLTRRAIQLGLKDDILMKYSSQWIVSITDVTPFVRYQHKVLQKKGADSISTPLERVYTPPSQIICQRIGLI